MVKPAKSRCERTVTTPHLRIRERPGGTPGILKLVAKFLSGTIAGRLPITCGFCTLNDLKDKVYMLGIK
ncbi:hypothetical protein MATL_G00156490 [Megalops atlanticus]|uniref:Uncharacterized protein n=1 Tax=Megalops atlanticus TaxID=7932 RepID=A0A9D3PPV4_MEGAT|nr:hypothetical protein MATL_G00156490 [Megalops atlanticus]